MKRAILGVATACLLAACGGGTAQHSYHTAYGTQAHAPTFGLPPAGVHPPLASLQQVATVEMFDAVTVSNIPVSAGAVAGYTSGLWPTFTRLVALFPRAHVVSINITARYHANCLDIEPGDATPSQAAAWVRADMAAGFRRPCLYANLSTMPAVKANLAMNGIARSSVFLWDADWTFHQHLDLGYDATQWTDHALGRSLDESTVSLAFLGVTQAPKPPAPAPIPAPKPKPKPPVKAKGKRRSFTVTCRLRPRKGSFALACHLS